MAEVSSVTDHRVNVFFEATSLIAPYPNMLNRGVVEALAEFNLFLPVNVLVALYYDDASWRRTVLTAARLVTVYTAILLFYYKHIRAGAILAGAFAVLTLAFAAIKPRSERHSHTYSILCASMPTNYVLNTVASRGNKFKAVYALLQTVVRASLIGIIILETYVYRDYANAWSCYGDASNISEYTSGPCPLYTHDYNDDWACTDRDPNEPCLGKQSPSFEGSHWSRHGAIIGTSILYAQHVVAAVTLG